jgi:hypothetical protein
MVTGVGFVPEVIIASDGVVFILSLRGEWGWGGGGDYLVHS